MESNWQRNVALYGLVGAGYKRLARSLQFPQYMWGQYARRDASSFALFYAPDPDQLPVWIGDYNLGNLHFPAGLPVEPD